MEVLLQQQRVLRVDYSTGKASVKDVIALLTGRRGSAASQLVKSFAKKHPDVAQNFDRVSINGHGEETPVASFHTLLDMIFLVGIRHCITTRVTIGLTPTRPQVDDCMRTGNRKTLEQKFDAAQTLCTTMRADVSLVHEYAKDLVDEYHLANKSSPPFLLDLAEHFTRGTPKPDPTLPGS